MQLTTKLTERLRNGDKEALFSMMAFYYNDLFRYGIKFTADKDITKDIIGQFFIHVWDHRQQFCAAENFKCYLIVAFKRFVIDYLRKISRQLNLSDYEAQVYEYSYEDYIVAWQSEESVKALLHKAIQELPERQRELIQLRFYEQLSHEEIAIRTSLSIRTVYNKLHEAIKKLRSPLLKESILKNW
jgi:RNA polymerase sigma-70 factor (ECF subfamily)